MARMFPISVDAEQASSRAERLLFDIFKKGLPNEYTVVHRARWYLPAEVAVTVAGNGEADFVLIHPQRGILVLEAKSGSLSYSATTGKWSIRDGQGPPRNHKRGPLQQAEGNRHALEFALRRALPELPACRFGFAVVMPDCDYREDFARLDLPNNLFLGVAVCVDVGRSIERAYEHFLGVCKRRLGLTPDRKKLSLPEEIERCCREIAEIERALVAVIPTWLVSVWRCRIGRWN